jgi:hypothetical protein
MVCVDRQPIWTGREERWKNIITSGSQLVLRCEHDSGKMQPAQDFPLLQLPQGLG